MSEQKAKRVTEPLFEIREYEAELFAPIERKVETKVEEKREAELFPDMGSMVEGIMQPMVMMLTLGMVMPVMQQAIVGVLQSTEVTVIVKPGSIVAVDVKNSVLAVEVKGGAMNVTVEGGTISVKTEPGTVLSVDLAEVSFEGTVNVTVESGQLAITFQESQFPDNLLSNPGFEEGEEGWTLESGWSIDNAEFYAGTASAKGVQGASESFIYSSDVIKVTPGQLFTVIAVFRGSGLTGNGLRLALRCLDPVNQEFLRYIYGEPHTDDIEGEWTTVRYVFTIPDDTGYIQVAVSLDAGSGTGWVDNVYAAKGQIHQIGQTIIGQMGTINVAIVQSDVTINISVVNATIAMPIDIQGSTIALAIDIQAATIALPVDIQAQTMNLKIDIAAQSVDYIDIRIAGQIGDVNVNIANVSGEVTFNVKITDATGVTFDVKITDATGVTFIVKPEDTAVFKIDIANVSYGAIEVKQSGSWTVNAVQSGDWTINAVQSGSWTVNIQNTAETAIYIQTAPDSKLDINIADSVIDLTIINPSGIPLYTGESGITGTIVRSVKVSGGSEYTVVSLSGRGRIHAIGWAPETRMSYDSLRLRIYKKNSDGSFTKVVDLSAYEFDVLNGLHVLSEFINGGASGVYRRAAALSGAGGLTYFNHITGNEGFWGCVLTVPFDFKYGAEVRIYNPTTYSPYVDVVVLYGTYET